MSRWIRRHLLLPAFETLYQGRKTFRYARDLARTQWLGRSELEGIQLAALQRLLGHAYDTCPYYRRSWDELGLQSIHSLEDFRAWPTIGRAEIGGHRAEMRSTASGLRVLSKSTGGSTGEPLHFDLSTDSNDRRNAISLRGYEWAGATLGCKQFYLWGVALGAQTARQRRKDRLYHWLYGRRYASTFGLGEESCAQYVERFNDYRPDAIVAYTSSLYEFARMIRQRGLSVHTPNAIVVGAEKLFPFQRELIEGVFQAPVFETYGSREFMLIGGECDRHSGLHVSQEHLIVEVLDEDGHPAPDGAEGDVVITDLYNYGMPFIRYRNGDRAVAGWGTCPCGRGLPLLREVSGRSADILRTPDGRCITGLIFPHLMKDFAGVKRFQVAQDEPDHVALRVVLRSGWGDGDRERIDGIMRSTLGPTMRFDIVPVDDIPLTGSGKLRVVVNLCRDTAPATTPA